MTSEESSQGPDSSKIKVAIRVRPLQEHEINAGHETNRFLIDKNSIR